MTKLTAYDLAILSAVTSAPGGEAQILTAAERTAVGRLTSRGCVTWRLSGERQVDGTPIVLAKLAA